MQLSFTKMQGLGNDFVVLEGLSAPVVLTKAQTRWLAHRQLGVGCDQILIVEPAQDKTHHFRYRIFNADGGEVENCGNGARCFARYVTERGLITLRAHEPIRVETLGGVITLTLTDDHQVTVNMGAPVFEPARIPFLAPAQALTYSLSVAGQMREFSVLSMGNPHAVQVVPTVNTAPVATEGPLIENHEAFPQRVNAGFMEIVDRTHIKLRVFERGAGETLACGTGACAAVVAGITRGLLDGRVSVATRGGPLTIEWARMGQPVLMTGPAEFVFTGQIDLPEFPQETSCL
jgi:diaminopimelate epimerase